MKLKEWAVVAAIAIAVIGGGMGRCYYQRAVQFEARARAAEQFSNHAQVLVNLYQDDARRAAAAVASRDTVIRRLQRRRIVVDSLHPPDSADVPNIAVRDSLIEAQAHQISDLQSQTLAQAGAINLLQASRDELQRALASRPKVYSRLVGPSIGLGVSIGYCGDLKPCVSVGVSINIGGLRL